ncbi:hypothetical protein Emed_001704 [Eimeria media]
MASSVLEVLRSAHEEVEKLEDVAAQLLLQQQEIEGDAQQQQQQQQLAPLSFKPKRLSERKRKESLRLQAAVSDCVSRIQERAKGILSLYTDADGLKREETLYLGGQRQLRRTAASGSSADVWVNFYDRIKEIRQTHKKRQVEAPEEAQLPVHSKSVDELLQEFMEDAEAAGRRVDLAESYRLFCGLKRVQQHLLKEAKEKELSRLRKKGASAEALAAKASALDEELGSIAVDYLTYLQRLGDFSRIPRHLKYKQPDYLHFLTETENYLENFFFRRYPLINFDEVRDNCTTFAAAVVAAAASYLAAAVAFAATSDLAADADAFYLAADADAFYLAASAVSGLAAVAAAAAPHLAIAAAARLVTAGIYQADAPPAAVTTLSPAAAPAASAAGCSCM